MLKDCNVDLCGELGHEAEDSFPCLGREETFTFACKGCGDCCRGREDIVLSGYDLYRISRRLRLPPRLVMRGFCRQYLGRASRLPVVRLAPVKEERSNCPFLVKNRCAIHEVKPLVCALYPLGQEIHTDGRIEYFFQPIACGGTLISAKLRDYLARYQIDAREEIDLLWAKSCIALSARMKRLEESLEGVLFRRAQDKLLSALYLNYSYEEDFLPQFERNLAQLEQELDKLARMQVRLHRRPE